MAYTCSYRKKTQSSIPPASRQANRNPTQQEVSQVKEIPQSCTLGPKLEQLTRQLGLETKRQTCSVVRTATMEYIKRNRPDWVPTGAILDE